MVKQQLIKSLRKAKIDKESKWVYNLVAWALEHHTQDYTDFQRRIQSSIHYAKGKYKSYWDNPLNMERHHKSQKKCIENNKVKYRQQSKEYNREVKVAHDLFKKGELSEKSIKVINKEIKRRSSIKNGN